MFGDLPALNWHTYGSGHLHGLSAPDLNLDIDLEPDVLHRETQRRLSLGSGDQTQPLILERDYTNLGQLDHLTLRGAQANGGQQYQYDALGRMSFRALQGEHSKVIAYSYDAAGRLTGSQHGDQAHRYTVDAAGNRLDGQQALSDNRLSQLNGTRYRYDGAGNMIERQQPDGERLTLGYDGANRLVQLTHTSAYGHTTEAAYRYDALGRRISKTVRHTNGTTATIHYGWDGDRIVREESENQRSTIVYEPGSFVPMLRIDETQPGQMLSAFVTDALGTPMQLVAVNGETKWQAQPDDWAAVSPTPAPTAIPRRPPTATMAWAAGSARPCATPTALLPTPTTAGTATASCGKKAIVSARPSSTSRVVLCPCCVLMRPNKARRSAPSSRMRLVHRCSSWLLTATFSGRASLMIGRR
ncbi:RHS domain-containing protein [Halomonas citrativorans]|uniref:RHS domain-containing protein n=1 Tax=Halomonas citrativorans TaxID=2742612 RepID=UPI001868D8E1|nr:RHS domain-containing protein [Halomonas citrativorans]